MSEFIPLGGHVWMTGKHTPWRMSDIAVDTMLDLFEREGETTRFNDLYEAQKAAMGEDFIPRVTSLRKAPVLVVNNTPDVAANNFTQALEQTL